MNSKYYNLEYLQRKINNVKKGIKNYRTICRSHHVLYSFFNCLIIVIPELDDELELLASKYITDYMKNRHYKRFFVISLSDSLQEIKELSGYINTCIVTKKEIEEIIESFSFCMHSPNVVILSLHFPVGRNASNILSYSSIQIEDIVKFGIFHLKIKDNPSLAKYIQSELIYKIVYLFRCVFSLMPDLMMRLYYNYIIKPGAVLYEKLFNKYNNSYIFIAPYSGTGDVYLSSMMLSKYAVNSGIDDYIVVCIGNSNSKVCSVFGIKSEAINLKDMGKFVRFISFVGLCDGECKFLHHDPPNLSIGILDKMRNVKNLDFFSMISNGVYAVNDKSLVSNPVFDSDSNEIVKIFVDNNLIYNKTVLLAPYNYTLPKMKMKFWEQLALLLKKKGYTVCTNCSNPKEKPIKGTIPVFLPYRLIVPFLDKAGVFISIRSGLCDIVSTSVCKKIILYLKGFNWNSKDNIDYFSLERMGISDDAIELTYENNKTQILLAEDIIRNYF